MQERSPEPSHLVGDMSGGRIKIMGTTYTLIALRARNFSINKEEQQI